MSAYLLAFLIGAIAGLRAMTAPMAVSWAARLGWLNLAGTWLALLGSAAAPYIVTVLALAEMVNDKLPKTPSRKEAGPFGVRILMGAVCGYALAGLSMGGLVAGAAGAVAGTLGGYEFRARLVKASGGKDLPIALLEDAIAVGAAFLIVSR